MPWRGERSGVPRGLMLHQLSTVSLRLTTPPRSTHTVLGMSRRRATVIASLVRTVEAAGRPLHRAEICTMCHPRTLDRAVARGALARVAPGYYASAATATLPGMRIAAAAAWMPAQAHIAGGAALHLWGIEGYLGARVPIASAPDNSGPAPPGMRLWRSRSKANTYILGGVRVASMEDAFVQWWCLRGKPLSEGPALDILRQGRVDARRAREAVDRYPRVAARAVLERLLTDFADGVHSALELRARRDLFSGPRWARWERQGEVRVESRTFRVDMLHRAARIAV